MMSERSSSSHGDSGQRHKLRSARWWYRWIPHTYSGYEGLMGELAPRLAARGHVRWGGIATPWRPGVKASGRAAAA